MTDNKKNVSTNIKEGTVIYSRGDEVNELCVVIKGKVSVQCGYLSSIVGSGSILGINDIFSGSYQADYVAYEDVTCMNISVNSIDQFYEFCQKNKGYGSVAITYMSRYISTAYKKYENVYDKTASLIEYINEAYDEYIDICKSNMLDASQAEIDDLSGILPAKLMCKGDIAYYIACNNISAELQKEYYSSDNEIYRKHITEQQRVINDIHGKCEKLLKVIDRITDELVTDYNSIFRFITDLAVTFDKIDKDNSQIVSRVRDIIRIVNDFDSTCVRDMGYSIKIDKHYIKTTYQNMMTGNSEITDNSEAEKLSSLKNSINQILSYAETDEDSREEFKNLVVMYGALNDKFSKEEGAVRLRKGLIKHFYTIYGDVFERALRDNNIPLPVRLFLDYGYVSEEILTENHLKELVNLGEDDMNTGPCNVFTISQWLTKIKNGKREPSKNDFDVDYDEDLREKIKNKEITNREAAELLEDYDKKTQFEIDNFFKSTHKLVSTQITTFVPILCSDNCTLGLAETKTTKYKINSAVKKILEMDFSLFTREVVYTNPEIGIDKDYIIKEVFPDVIIMPCYGDKGVMWQDISGRKRDTPARFVLPAFLEKDELSVILPLMGRYRWEICRTIQGIKWNDVRIKSLTSEYQDYIQFYRKNSELTEEWREKIRNQIKSCRNNTREIFTRDYIDWLTRESAGTMRLNKIVREIMATYCPFPVEVRKKLSGQLIFVDAMKRFEKNRDKMHRLSESKCLKIEKAGHDVPEEMAFTRDYYGM